MRKQLLLAGCFLIIIAMFFLPSSVQGASDTVKIGVVLPLTGSLAAVGENAKNGVVLATEKINKKGGVRGQKVELIIEDGKSAAKDSINAIIKLIDVNGVKFVVGEVASQATLAIAPIAEKNKVILISPGTSSPKLSEAGEYVFRTWHSADFEAQYFSNVILKRFKVNKLAVLFVNNEYGNGLRASFNKYFSGAGGNIVSEEPFEQGQLDYRSVLNKIKKITKGIEGIYLISYPKEAGHILRQSKELQINAKLFASDGIQDQELINIAKDAANNVIYPHMKAPDKSAVKVNEFIDDYKNMFKKDPGVTSDTSYDAMNLILYGIEKVGYNADKVKEVLINIKNYSGASGKISFDKNGDIIKEMELKTIDKENFVVIEE